MAKKVPRPTKRHQRRKRAPGEAQSEVRRTAVAANLALYTVLNTVVNPSEPPELMRVVGALFDALMTAEIELLPVLRLGQPWTDIMASVRGLRVALEVRDDAGLAAIAKSGRDAVRRRYAALARTPPDLKFDWSPWFEPALSKQERLAVLADGLDAEMRAGRMSVEEATARAGIALTNLAPDEFVHQGAPDPRARVVALKARASFPSKPGETVVRAAARALGAGATRVHHLFDGRDKSANRNGRI